MARYYRWIFTEKYISENIDNHRWTNFEKRYSTMPLLDKWVFIGILLDRVQSETTNHRACFHPTPSHRSSRQSFSCLWRARLPRIFPFTFYSGKQEGILVAVQTRSPIARGNWVDIGNESKEQITRSKGWHALRWSGEPMSGVGTWS